MTEHILAGDTAGTKTVISVDEEGFGLNIPLKKETLVSREFGSLANLPWSLSATSLQPAFGDAPVHLYNDLVAVSQAIPYLANEDHFNNQSRVSLRSIRITKCLRM